MQRRHGVYRTLAVTVAVPVSVNVHDCVLLPPLEHAPDQIALRPPETVSVIAVPVENDADEVPPTATLMPDGADVTRWPLLPLALTVSVADPPGGGLGGGGGGAEASGFTVNVADFVTPPPDTEMVTSVCCVTAVVKMLNPPRVTPDGTITLF